MTVREARAQLARIIDRSVEGGSTVITRDGTPVAAVVSIRDYEALEDAVDEYFARRAEEIAETEDGQPRYTMSQIVADLFDEHDNGRAA